MSALQYQLPSIGRASWRLPLPRLEPLVVALGLVLPVPAFAATGMSIPMPTVVERLAAALVPWTEVAVLSEDTKERAVRGSIVQTEAERAAPAHSPAPTIGRQQAPVPVERPKAIRRPVRPSVAPVPQSERGESRPAGRPRSRPKPVAAVGPVVREPHKNPVTTQPAEPANPEQTPKADKPAKEDKHPRTAPAPTAPATSPVGTRTPEPTAPTLAHTPVDTVTQSVDGVVEPVVTTVEPVEETVKEKVDHVVVSVDKTAEKVVGSGERVTHDVNVIVQKLPKVLGG